MDDSRPQPKICPLMSHQVIVPAPASNLARPDGLAVTPLAIPCWRERCAMAYLDLDQTFLGCGLAVAHELDRAQASLSELARSSVPAVGAMDALAAVGNMQSVLERLLYELVQVRMKNWSSKDASSPNK